MILYIIRGHSGSGKTTLAIELMKEMISKGAMVKDIICEADGYFYTEEGDYNFDRDMLKEAHRWCQEKVRMKMKEKWSKIAVSNTFTRKWEYEPYVKMAKEHGYSVFILECQNDFQNVHDVPEMVVRIQKERMER